MNSDIVYCLNWNRPLSVVCVLSNLQICIEQWACYFNGQQKYRNFAKWHLVSVTEIIANVEISGRFNLNC